MLSQQYSHTEEAIGRPAIVSRNQTPFRNYDVRIQILFWTMYASLPI